MSGTSSTSLRLVDPSNPHQGSPLFVIDQSPGTELDKVRTKHWSSKKFGSFIDRANLPLADIQEFEEIKIEKPIHQLKMGADLDVY